jgi:EmrB/QacA subfamily drug resistance transporter
LILAAVTFSLFLIMLDNTVITVALPALQAGVHASLSQLEWFIDAYSLTFAVLLLSGGKLADYFGRRRIFVIGLAWFTLASLWCGLATSGGSLIAARGAQGIGAALMLPATISIIADAFSGRERGLAFGIWAAVSGIALAIGPLVGGIIIDIAHWSWIFYINIPIGVIGLLATFAVVPESRDETADQRLDFIGLITSGGAMLGLAYGLIEANTHGWGSTPIVLCFVGAALLAVAFVLFELVEERPMFDIRLFRRPTFAGVNLAGLVVMCSLLGFIFFTSLYLQNVRGFSPIHTGWIFLITTIPMSLSSPLAGKAADRIGAKAPIAIGLALFGAALVAMASSVGVHASMWRLYPWLFVAGFGFGLVLPPATTTVVASVPDDKSGVAAGLMQAMRQLGAALGIAISGSIMNAKTTGLGPFDFRYNFAFVHGLQDVMIFSGVLSIAAAICCVWLIRGRPATQLAVAPGIAGAPPR